MIIHPMNQLSQKSIPCWAAAGNHLNGCGQTANHEFGWLKADWTPLFFEHMSFRLGNQLFFVRAETPHDEIDMPSDGEALFDVANDPTRLEAQRAAKRAERQEQHAERLRLQRERSAEWHRLHDTPDVT